MRYPRVACGVVAASVLALGGGGAAGPAAGQPQGACAPATFAPQKVGHTRLTAAVHMTKDEAAPARGFTGPTSMLADPDNPRILVAATADLRTRVCQLLRSTDAGRTWHFSASVPAPKEYPYCTNGSAGVAEASIAWGRSGTLYYAMNGFGEKEGTYAEGHTSMVLARSDDLGETWKSTLVENNRDKPAPAPADFGATVAVDTSGPRDVVYVGFSQFFTDAPQTSPLNNGPVMVATSTDGGATFGAPVNISDSAHLTRTIEGKTYPMLMEGYFGAPLLTAHDGTVLVVSGSETPFDNHPAASNFDARFVYAMPQLVGRSTDQGRTWTVEPMGPPIYAGNGSQTGLGWTPKGGPSGTFLAAYAGSPESAFTSGSGDIILQRSADDGKTWTDPVVLNDESSNGKFTNFYPQLGVAPNGRVDVVWQDTRGQTDYWVAVRYTYSADAGATWAPNVEVTDRSTDFNLGISFNSDLRQPPGVASASEYAAIGWADTRLGDELTQTQDNFSARAQFAPVPPRTSTVTPVVAAVFGGLVAAGLVLLLVLAVRRRRTPATSPPG